MKRYIIPFLLSAILYILTAFMAGYTSLRILNLSGFALAILVGFVVYFIFTYLVLRKYAEKANIKWILMSILAGILILDTPVRIMSFNDTLISLPFVIFRIIAVFSAYFFFRFKGYIGKTLSILLPLSLCIWMSFPGYGKWNHYLSYGTTKGEVKKAKEKTVFDFQQSTGETVSTSDFTGKYVILDFWSSSCGVCIRELPNVQEAYDEFQDNEKVLFYSVHCRFSERNETYSTGQEFIEKRGHAFPVLSIDATDPSLTSLVKGYPTVLILDPAGNLVFRGDLRNAKKYVLQR